MKDKVFISYSHEDSKYLNQIKRHFTPFENKINFWDDSKILPGLIWREEIDKALAEAKVAILLISADFLNSNFIAKVELPSLLVAAQERGTTILSVLLKPCLFSEYPEINKYQAVNSPSFPFIKMSDVVQEELCVDLFLRVKQILNNI